MCIYECKYPQSSEENVRSPGVEVLRCYEPPNMGAEY